MIDNNLTLSGLLSFKVSKRSGGYYDEFWAHLAERLMLDELLAGEANPTEFLKDQILETCKHFKVQHHINKAELIKAGK